MFITTYCLGLFFLIRDKMTNDKMTKWRFEALPQCAKTVHRGSDRVGAPAVV